MLRQNLQWQVVQGLHNHPDLLQDSPQLDNLKLGSLIATTQGLLVPIVLDANAALIVVQVEIAWNLVNTYMGAKVAQEFINALHQAHVVQETQEVQFILTQPELTAQLYQAMVYQFLKRDFVLTRIYDVEIYDLSKLLQQVTIDTMPKEQISADNPQEVLYLVLQHRKAVCLESAQAQVFADKLAQLQLTQQQSVGLLMHALQQVHEQDFLVGQTYKAKVVNIDKQLNCAFVEVGNARSQALLRFNDLSAEFKSMFSKITTTQGKDCKKNTNSAAQGKISTYLDVGQNIVVTVKSHAYDDKLMRVAALAPQEIQDGDVYEQLAVELQQLANTCVESLSSPRITARELEAVDLTTPHQDAYAFPWYFTNNCKLWGGHAITQYQLLQSKILEQLNILTEHVQLVNKNPLRLDLVAVRSLIARAKSAPAQWISRSGVEFSAVTSKLGMAIDVDTGHFEFEKKAAQLRSKLEKLVQENEQIKQEANAQQKMNLNIVSFAEGLERVISRENLKFWNEITEPRNAEVLFNIYAVLGALEHLRLSRTSGQIVLDLVNLSKKQAEKFNEAMKYISDWLKSYKKLAPKAFTTLSSNSYLGFLNRLTLNVQNGMTSMSIAGKYTNECLTRNGLLEMNVQREGVSLKEALTAIQENILTMRRKAGLEFSALLSCNIVQQLELASFSRIITHYDKILEPEVVRCRNIDRQLKSRCFQPLVQFPDEMNSELECCEMFNSRELGIVNAKGSVLETQPKDHQVSQLIELDDYILRIRNALEIETTYLVEILNRVRIDWQKYQQELGAELGKFMHVCNTTACYLESLARLGKERERQRGTTQYQLVDINKLSVFYQEV